MPNETDAFRTISEVADELGLPAHVLRFWETRFPEIQPMKRAGGRRYYRPFDVDLLQLIQRLLHDQGYTIKGVQRLFSERGIEGAAAIAEAAGTKGDESKGVEPKSDKPAEVAAAAEPLAVEPAGSGEPAAPPEDERTSAVLDALGLLDECADILARSRRHR